jgi:3-hydroxyacyl-[acyl-carrier-protein] dehydratase
MDNDILKYLPQRPPFLFVDEILDFNRQEKTIRTQKYFSGEEDFFRGHFPGNPVVPGVLQNEAHFQSAAILMNLLHESSPEQGRLGVVTKIENCRFKQILKPGDTLTMEVKVLEEVSHFVFFSGKAVNQQGQTVVTLSFTCALIDG